MERELSVQAYPLHWPPGFPRAKYRERGQFKSSFDTAHANVVRSLKLFATDSGKKLEHAIMSSNITLTNVSPADPGVAVWFVWDGVQICIPVDRYDTPAKNLQAIHHIIEARRVELRHGTLALVRATFQGFQALPAPTGKHWRDILQVNGNASRDAVEANFKRLAKDRHPDAGGSAEQMAELNNARETALREIG
jgi:hypothetical protein